MKRLRNRGYSKDSVKEWVSWAIFLFFKDLMVLTDRYLKKKTHISRVSRLLNVLSSPPGCDSCCFIIYLLLFLSGLYKSKCWKNKNVIITAKLSHYYVCSKLPHFLRNALLILIFCTKRQRDSFCISYFVVLLCDEKLSHSSFTRFTQIWDGLLTFSHSLYTLCIGTILSCEMENDTKRTTKKLSDEKHLSVLTALQTKHWDESGTQWVATLE